MGFKKTNRLYRCLLFTTVVSHPPGSEVDLSALRHQDSAAHLQTTVILKTFGDTRVDLQLDEHCCNHTTAHNNKVRQNREILKRLINVVTFLGKQELAFRGHDESKDSENYLELL